MYVLKVSRLPSEAVASTSTASTSNRRNNNGTRTFIKPGTIIDIDDSDDDLPATAYDSPKTAKRGRTSPSSSSERKAKVLSPRGDSDYDATSNRAGKRTTSGTPATPRKQSSIKSSPNTPSTAGQVIDLRDSSPDIAYYLPASQAILNNCGSDDEEVFRSAPTKHARVRPVPTALTRDADYWALRDRKTEVTLATSHSSPRKTPSRQESSLMISRASAKMASGSPSLSFAPGRSQDDRNHTSDRPPSSLETLCDANGHRHHLQRADTEETIDSLSDNGTISGESPERRSASIDTSTTSDQNAMVWQMEHANLDGGWDADVDALQNITYLSRVGANHMPPIPAVDASDMEMAALEDRPESQILSQASPSSVTPDPPGTAHTALATVSDTLAGLYTVLKAKIPALGVTTIENPNDPDSESVTRSDTMGRQQQPYEASSVPANRSRSSSTSTVKASSSLTPDSPLTAEKSLASGMMLDKVGLSPRAQSKRPEPAICAAPPGLSQQPWRSISSDSDDGNESDSSTVHPDDGFPGRGLSYSGPETTPDRQASRESLTPTLVAPQAASSNVRANASKSRVQQPHPLGYMHRGAIEWTGSETSGEFNYRGLDTWNLRKKRGNTRRFFESYMNEQIVKEEPFAPRVNVIDPSSKESDTSPPSEFVYTNRVIYRKGVPTSLKHTSCTCADGCRSDDDACACSRAQRQLTNRLREHYHGRTHNGFAYDCSGLLRLPGPLPIWECNSYCSCPADCVNRRVGNGRKVRLDIVKTERKGWGIQAAEGIPKGSFLCLYSGEVLLNRFAEARGRLNDKMPNPLSYIFDIDSEWLAKINGGNALEEEGLLVIADNRPVSTEAATGFTQDRVVPASRNIKDFGYVKALYAIDARHYVKLKLNGNLSRFFNHSCDPNAVIRSVFVDDQDIWKPLLCIFTRRNIKVGAEVTISYKGDVREGLEEREISEPTVMKQDKPNKQERGTSGHITKQAGKVNAAGNAGEVIDQECFCGTAACDGRMFWEDDAEDEDEED